MATARRHTVALGLTVILAACGVTRPLTTAPTPARTALPSVTATPRIAQRPEALADGGSPTPSPSPSVTEQAGSASSGSSCLPAGLPLPAPAAPQPPAALGDPVQLARGPIPVYRSTIVHTYPHDRGAFTEGLVYDGGMLYESTGRYGQSTLRRVALETGAVQLSCALPDVLFGEGIVAFDDTIVQLTWQSHVGFVYARDSFTLLRTFTYPTEGWGLTHDRTRLIMSDGTSTLRFLDPQTLQETGRIEVVDDHGPVTQLNELEYVRGEIFANIWQTDRIARVDPQTGHVRGWIDLSGLLAPADRLLPVDVLNGIAYDAEHDRLFVTGKWWPKLFEIRLVPAT